MKYELKPETKMHIFTNLKIGNFWYIFESSLVQNTKTKLFKFYKINSYFYNSDSSHSSEQQLRGFDNLVNQEVKLEQLSEVFFNKVKIYLDKKSKSDRKFQHQFKMEDIFLRVEEIYSNGWGGKNDLKVIYTVNPNEKSVYFSDSLIYKTSNNSNYLERILAIEKTYLTNNLSKSTTKYQKELTNELSKSH